MSFKERFSNKVVLAPMVRICTLPMRLLSLSYGADLVYTEELIDLKLIKAERTVNDALGTIDYVDVSDGCVIFRTCNEEKDRLILQIGTCSPERALQVAKFVEGDVAGIDVNMGCPKEFSTQGGMGAALLYNPDLAVAILTSLVNGVSIPVTCKIRVLDSIEDTILLCKKLEATGISAIAVHGRTKNERPQHRNRNEYIRAIGNALSIPVIANGGSKEIDNYKDIQRFKEETGASSVMLARAAEWNASVFQKSGVTDPKHTVIRNYLKMAVKYDNPISNTKYCIQNMLRDEQESEIGKATLAAHTLFHMCGVWGLTEYFDKINKEVKINNRWMNDAKTGVRMARCRFVRALYLDPLQLPKSQLARHAHFLRLPPPVYSVFPQDKLFHASVTFNGVTYLSDTWEKNKRFAEQGAALVALTSLGLVDKSDLRKYGAL